jgi:hypothetical protein
MTTYYKATFADGRVLTRSTAGRTYSHAHTPGRRTAQWAGSEILARKAAKGGEVVPAIEITAQEYRALNSAAQAAALEAARDAGREYHHQAPEELLATVARKASATFYDKALQVAFLEGYQAARAQRDAFLQEGGR